MSAVVLSFCRRHVLNMSNGIQELGDVSWPLIVCLGVSWFVCFMCLFKGIKSMGKVIGIKVTDTVDLVIIVSVKFAVLPNTSCLLMYELPHFLTISMINILNQFAGAGYTCGLSKIHKTSMIYRRFCNS